MRSEVEMGPLFPLDREVGFGDGPDDSADVFASLLPVALIERLDRHRRRLCALLLDTAPQGWLRQLHDELAAFRQMVFMRPDETLFYLTYVSAHDPSMYSATHAMTCVAIGDLVGQWCRWTHDEITAISAAAVTMNLGMTALQDQLAVRSQGLNADERQTIDAHADTSRRLLMDAGVEDPLWLEVVERHHERQAVSRLRDAPAARRLSEVLRRVDIYSAKLSRRRHRQATSSAIAARDTFLTDSGAPDEIGAGLLRVIGLYPPGSWVSLANGDIGIVIRRGCKAHLPIVASVRRSDGGLYHNPQCRDTADSRFAIVRGLRGGDARVTVEPHKMLACYLQPAVF
ncbi:MAG: hypothetical protein J7598_03610 [Mitsuaria chitosanitabida]|uniref:HD-GYP domain-containing protein n=1 Tax=Roseateles chitosanitabidus TaxID=65048 RepID=UPI001B1C1F62|nr:hypothetical protein [Roseateles chitosanitabidus]MBO9685676.1 hypothetical protein [Roseateles chitosanitabidus]